MFACTMCRDTTKLAVNHFTNLGTLAMEGPASATINCALNYNGTSCNPSAGGLTGVTARMTGSTDGNIMEEAFKGISFSAQTGSRLTCIQQMHRRLIQFYDVSKVSITLLQCED
jgi:hypothetical protein